MGTRLFLAALVLGLAAPATAGKQRSKKARKSIVFVAEKGASAEIIAAVETFCVKAESFYEVGVLRKKLKKRAGKCKDAACLAKLAKKKKLTTLVLGRAHSTDSGGVRFAFQTIDVETRAVAAESELIVPSVDQAQPMIARAYFGIAGITTPGFVTIAHAPTSVKVDGTEVEVKDGKLELPPGPHKLSVKGEEQDVMVLPKETREVAFASLAPPPPPTNEPGPAPEPVAAGPAETEAVEVAAVDDPVAPLAEEPAVEQTVESGSGLGLLSWVGIGVAGAGVVMLGVGGVFGTQTTVELDRGTTQLEAHQMNEDARAKATLANVMLIGGGALVATGATLFVLDLLGSDETSVSVTATPVADGAAVVVGGRW